MSFLRASSLFCFALLSLPLSSIACASPSDASDDDGAQSADISIPGLGGGGDKGKDPAQAKAGERVAATATVWGRSIRLHLSDADDAGWATIDDGDAGDEAWLD